MDTLTEVLIIGVAIVVFFGASTIMTAYYKTQPTIDSFLKDTDTRCDLCLKQFKEVNCDHSDNDKVCLALRNSYCNLNCTIQLV